MIRTVPRRDLKEEHRYTISCSFNPYNPFYFEKRAFLLDFDLLAFHAKKVIFFTYIRDTYLEHGKFMLMKYPAPSEVINAEVRFIFDTPKTYAGKFIEDPLEREYLMSWVPFLEVLKEISNLAIALSEEGKSILSLNLLSLKDATGGFLDSLIKESRVLSSLIDLIKLYDELIEVLFRKLSGLPIEEMEIIKEAT